MIRINWVSLMFAAAICSLPLDVALAAPIGGVIATANTPINFNAGAGAAILTNGVIDDDDWLTAPHVILGWSDPLWNLNPSLSADSGVSQPRLTFDLGATYLVNSVTVNYTVDHIAGDDTRNLRAPDSMTASFSAAGSGGPFAGSIAETGWDDSAETISTPGVGDARSLTTSLGVVANAVRLDFLTNGEWLFISEISFDGVAIPEPTTSLLIGSLGVALAGQRRRRRSLQLK